MPILDHISGYFRIFAGSAGCHDLGVIIWRCHDPPDLDTVTERVLTELLSAGPQAQVAMKQLLREVAAADTQEESASHTVPVIARLRVSDEGQEGMRAFVEKRRPKFIGE